MRALDTNILVRLVARDAPDQVEAAERIVAEGGVLILPTVLLETEWVLRARYAMPRDRIAVGLATICGQDGVTVASAASVAAALSRYAEAGDFADLLHFAIAAELQADTFATFDREFAHPAGTALRLEIL